MFRLLSNVNSELILDQLVRLITDPDDETAWFAAVTLRSVGSQVQMLSFCLLLNSRCCKKITQIIFFSKSLSNGKITLYERKSVITGYIISLVMIPAIELYHQLFIFRKREYLG